MKKIKLTLGILAICKLFAFQTLTSNVKNVIGNYGDKSSFELVLNADNTFEYVDHTKD